MSMLLDVCCPLVLVVAVHGQACGDRMGDRMVTDQLNP